MNEVTIPKGQIVKIGGLPYELLEDVHATGSPAENVPVDLQKEDVAEVRTSD